MLNSLIKQYGVYDKHIASITLTGGLIFCNFMPSGELGVLRILSCTVLACGFMYISDATKPYFKDNPHTVGAKEILSLAGAASVCSIFYYSGLLFQNYDGVVYQALGFTLGCLTISTIYGNFKSSGKDTFILPYSAAKFCGRFLIFQLLKDGYFPAIAGSVGYGITESLYSLVNFLELKPKKNWDLKKSINYTLLHMFLGAVNISMYAMITNLYGNTGLFIAAPIIEILENNIAPKLWKYFKERDKQLCEVLASVAILNLIILQSANNYNAILAFCGANITYAFICSIMNSYIPVYKKTNVAHSTSGDDASPKDHEIALLYIIKKSIVPAVKYTIVATSSSMLLDSRIFNAFFTPFSNANGNIFINFWNWTAANNVISKSIITGFIPTLNALTIDYLIASNLCQDKNKSQSIVSVACKKAISQFLKVGALAWGLEAYLAGAVGHGSFYILCKWNNNEISLGNRGLVMFTKLLLGACSYHISVNIVAKFTDLMTKGVAAAFLEFSEAFLSNTLESAITKDI